MADEKTPQNDETAEETTAQATAPAEPAAPALSAREERARRDHAAKSQRPQRTAEQRDAERRELRRHKAVARRRRREQEKAKRSGAEKGTGTPPAEPKVATPQTRTGTVVSSKSDKTITVRIDIARRHRRYEKIVRSTAKLRVHDEDNDANEGDRVRVVESRPLSRTKRWKLVEVLERAR
ncbi:MAG: 30S ribosomal protein S17 [Solirubrobacteraceae bacterium]